MFRTELSHTIIGTVFALALIAVMFIGLAAAGWEDFTRFPRVSPVPSGCRVRGRC